MRPSRHIKLMFLVFSVYLTACSNDAVNRFAYNAAANHQCMQDTAANPNRELSHETMCPGNDSIDGANYDEYKKRREN